MANRLRGLHFERTDALGCCTVVGCGSVRILKSFSLVI
jgi:hypothetical protein